MLWRMLNFYKEIHVTDNNHILSRKAHIPPLCHIFITFGKVKYIQATSNNGLKNYRRIYQTTGNTPCQWFLFCKNIKLTVLPKTSKSYIIQLDNVAF